MVSIPTTTSCFVLLWPCFVLIPNWGLIHHLFLDFFQNRMIFHLVFVFSPSRIYFSTVACLHEITGPKGVMPVQHPCRHRRYPWRPSWHPWNPQCLPSEIRNRFPPRTVIQVRDTVCGKFNSPDVVRCVAKINPSLQLVRGDTPSWLVGGWTNPIEKYARQNGSFPPK